MAEFTNPHNQMDAPRKYTKDELIRALRKDIAAEEEAASTYDAHAAACGDEEVKKVIQDIADEERAHVGEFQALIDKLSEDEEEFIDQGYDEVDEIAREIDEVP